MRICVIGAFSFDKLFTGGQPVKTRTLYYALVEKYGQQQVTYIETYGWKRHPLALYRQVKKAFRESDKIIMLPAHRGLLVFSELLTRMQRTYGKDIYYDVIGGWLPEKTAKKRGLKKKLMAFKGIWAETRSMEEALKAQGFTNVTVVPNFKDVPILSKEELKTEFAAPLPLCTFSRVTEKKGIGEAIRAVGQVNEDLGQKALHLDVYGDVDEAYAQEFQSLLDQHPEDVTYKGVASPTQSTRILKDYYGLLFPTKFYTEGVPGTLIDAYGAGVPVIAALWKNSREVFLQDVTGWGYGFEDPDGLKRLLRQAWEERERFAAMRPLCLEQARRYTATTVMEQIHTLLQ